MNDGAAVGGMVPRLAAVLVLVNAFFVPSEFGLVAVRRSRIDQLAAADDRGARRVQRALTHLDRYLWPLSSASRSPHGRWDGSANRRSPGSSIAGSSRSASIRTAQCRALGRGGAGRLRPDHVLPGRAR